MENHGIVILNFCGNPGMCMTIRSETVTIMADGIFHAV